MEERFIKNLIALQLKTKNICEGFEDNQNKPVVISNRLRLLLILEDMERISPSVLVPMLAMAKSNLNMLCKKLLNEKLIERVVDDFDRRVIYYSITEKGEKELNSQLTEITKNVKKYFYNNIDKEIISAVEKLNQKLS